MYSRDNKTYLPIAHLGTLLTRLRAFNQTPYFENLAGVALTGVPDSPPTKTIAIEDLVSFSNIRNLDQGTINKDLKLYNSKKYPHKWIENTPLFPPMTRDQKLSMHLDTIASLTVRKMTYLLMTGGLTYSEHKVFVHGIDSKSECSLIGHMFAGKMSTLGIKLNIDDMRSYLIGGGCQLKYEARGKY